MAPPDQNNYRLPPSKEKIVKLNKLTSRVHGMVVPPLGQEMGSSSLELEEVASGQSKAAASGCDVVSRTKNRGDNAGARYRDGTVWAKHTGG